MRVPGALEFVILSLAAWRLFRLVGFDEVTRPMRERITHRAEKPGYAYVGPGEYRATVDYLLHCPYCAGTHIAGALWLLWLVWPQATVGLSVPVAIAALVALVEVNHDAGDPDAWAEAEQEAAENA